MEEKEYMNEFTEQFEKGWSWYASILKMYYQRGMTYVAMPAQVISLLTFLKVWEETFTWFGLEKWMIYGTFPMILIVGCAIIGYIDQKHMWTKEGIMLARRVSPLTKKTYNIMAHTEELVIELLDKQKSLENEISELKTLLKMKE